MTYRYIWSRTVLDALADIYVTLTGPDQDRVAAGVAAFNAAISRDPFDVGESRAGSQRVAFLPLLKVLFVVDKDTQLVRVTSAERYGR